MYAMVLFTGIIIWMEKMCSSAWSCTSRNNFGGDTGLSNTYIDSYIDNCPNQDLVSLK